MVHNPSSPPPPFRAVIFDLGHTLIYYEGNWDEVYQLGSQDLIDSLHAAGIALDPQAFSPVFYERLADYRRERDAEFIELTTQYILRSLLAEYGYRDVPEEVLDTALESMHAASQAYWRTEEDTLPTLRRLQQQGYRLGLVSNAADDADVQKLIDNADLRGFFDVILTSAGVGRRKPHPAIFRQALEALDVSPQEAVMVGDVLGADILGAKNLGIAAVWITRRAERIANQSHEDTIQPDATIAALSELPELLANWSQRSSQPPQVG